MRRTLPLTVLATCATLLAGCGGGGGGGGGAGLMPPATGACSTAGQKQTVLTEMQSHYFWNDDPGQQAKYSNINLASYPATDDLLDFLRFQPDRFDRFFSFITTVESDTSFFSEGSYAGFGFSFQLLPGDVIRITQVFAGSPAESAGFARGYRIVEIEGRTIANIEANEGLDEILGPSTIGISRRFLLQDLNGIQFTSTPVKAEVIINPVGKMFTLQGINKTIGYFEYRTFISTGGAQLSSVFAAFANSGVTDVIVDLRYNGGGLLSVADQVASLLAGPANVSQISSFTRYNQSNNFRNSTTTFSSEPNSINLNSIAFITTDSTASASELVINSLEPYVKVALIGSRTFGKPVGQSAFDFCSNRLRAVTFEVVNVNNAGQYFDGLPVTCPASDELEQALGDPAEDSIATAIAYLDTGACPIVSAPKILASKTQTANPEPADHHRPDDTPAREFAGAY
jgi:carboxyl-terminal processing protease